MLLDVGNQYKRSPLHDYFGGNRQAGISSCSSKPHVLLFSNASGDNYGYEDGWRDDNSVYVYTGEGQTGDMQWLRGNKALRDHITNGKSLLLFEGKGMVRFLGAFVLADWFEAPLMDRDHTQRLGFKFLLVPLASLAVDQNIPPSDNGPMAAARSTSSTLEAVPLFKDAVLRVRERSKAVRDAVLARANGRCEYSNKLAPFLRPDGTPYLEVHHVEMLAEGGVDHPNHCVAIRPEIHREIHYGQHGATINAKLKAFLATITS